MVLGKCCYDVAMLLHELRSFTEGSVGLRRGSVDLRRGYLSGGGS